MKYLVYLFYIVLAIILITVATSNSQDVNVILAPDWLPVIGGLNFTAPLFIFLFIALFAGMALGLLLEYVREMRIRNHARRSQRALKKTQKELNSLKKNTGQHDDEVMALLE